MKEQQKRSVVYFEASVLRALESRAEETDRSLSMVVNETLKRALAEDVEDLAAFEDRASEPLISPSELRADLRKNGAL